MVLFKRISLVFFTFLIIIIANILLSSGYFRTVEPHFDGKILHKIALPGAEDITVSTKDSFAIISSTHRGVRPKNKNKKNGLYFLDLKSSNYKPVLLTANFDESFTPHGISLFEIDDGHYKIAVVNHPGKEHSIEIFDFKDQVLTHQKTIRDKSLLSPNDIFLVDENRFYFTNDHGYIKGLGKLAEEYLGLAVSNVVYYDSEKFLEVADGIGYANGINFDRNRNLLYVASPRKFLVKVFSVSQNGALNFMEDMPCGTGVDNIELDTDGNLWIGCHPNLLRYSAYSKDKKQTAPSEIIKITYRKKGDYSIENIYQENGEEMSGSTVAAPFGKLLFVGNVMAPEFLILQQN